MTAVVIAALNCELVEIDKMGVDDDFFCVGGKSWEARAVAGRLSVHEFLCDELTGAFTAYLDYLLLASEGGFDMRTTTPLFLSSAGYEPPVAGARAIAVDTGHADLLRAPCVHELVAGLLAGEHRW